MRTLIVFEGPVYSCGMESAPLPEPRMSASIGTRMSLLGLVGAVLALVGLMSTHSAFGVGPISIGVQVAAALLMVWARMTFGLRSFHAGANPTAGDLVTRGPFAFVRNPIYAAVILFAWTGVVVHFSLESALLGVVVVLGMLVRVFFEEKLLRVQYGPAYAEYEKRVKRLVPWVF